MTYPTDEPALTRLFKSLGARSPEEWVKYVGPDPAPHLAKYLFLKQAWDRILAEQDTTWINAAIERSKKNPNEPHAGLGASLERVLAAGASQEDLTEIGRCLQAELLFGVAYLLDGPAYSHPGLEGLQWALFRTDEEGKPVGEALGGIHESVLDTDPTGREMRPRGSDAR